jgi:hypothetical protein
MLREVFVVITSTSFSDDAVRTVEFMQYLLLLII